MQQEKYLADYLLEEKEIMKLEMELIRWQHQERNEYIKLGNTEKRRLEQTKTNIDRLKARRRLMKQILGF